MLQKSRKYLVIAVSLALLVSGCTMHRPDGVLSSHKMEDVLYDYHVALALSSKLSYNEKYRRVEYENYALRKNGITKAELDTSLVWYTRNPKELHKIYERLNERIGKEENAAAARLEKIEKKSFHILPGDSVDLWYPDRTQLMSMSPFYNPLLFEITPDTTFYLGDSLIWNVGARFFGNAPDSLRPSAYLSMSLYYPDSISTTDTIIRSDCTQVLELQCDAEQHFSKIAGSVVFIDYSGDESNTLLLSDISLIRRHVTLNTAEVNDSTSNGLDVPADSLTAETQQ